MTGKMWTDITVELNSSLKLFYATSSKWILFEK